MSDIRLEYQIEKTFKEKCESKNSCLFPVDFRKQFINECVRDIEDRLDGKIEKTKYGPPRIYALTLCHYNSEHEHER